MDKNVSIVAPCSWVDSLGTTVSIACAIQCSVFPLLIGVLPLFGLGFLLGDGVEKIFVTTSILIAVSSFSWGFRYHRRFYIFIFLISALALIAAGRLWVDEPYEIPIVISGTLLLSAGHFLNRRLCHLCAECRSHEHTTVCESTNEEI
jgi:MerC mercury resistance protein